ncbi:UNVERIFIED_CONTAM: hypothetical protein ABIC26_002902 [Paenibacillus sp. PvR008]
MEFLTTEQAITKVKNWLNIPENIKAVQTL